MVNNIFRLPERVPVTSVTSSGNASGRIIISSWHVLGQSVFGFGKYFLLIVLCSDIVLYTLPATRNTDTVLLLVWY